MILKEEKKISPMIVSHWKNKFDKAIRVLLISGVKSDELIAEIKKVENEKDS
jgi:hypothetical protein